MLLVPYNNLKQIFYYFLKQFNCCICILEQKLINNLTLIVVYIFVISFETRR